jgi:hypothetical protein
MAFGGTDFISNAQLMKLFARMIATFAWLSKVWWILFKIKNTVTRKIYNSDAT